MSTQQALWLPGIGQDFVVGTKEIDTPDPGQLLVKIISSGLNPLDWKIQDSGYIQFVPSYPAVIGEEAAGTVEAVGEGVTDFKKGDRIFFQAQIGSKFTTFQQYCIVFAYSAAKIPENISFDQAASVQVGIIPFAVALYAQQPEGLAHLAPWLEGGHGKYAGQPIVIMGGTSTLGQYATQLARLSGFSPLITTASFHNTELLSSLGATHVLDRKLSTAALKDAIAKITSTPIALAFDAISLPDTQQTAHDIITAGGTVITVRAPQVDNKSEDKVVQQVVGIIHAPPNRELGKSFMPVLTQWLADGTIKPNTVEVVPGGLNGVSSGLQRLKNNLVNGKKLVVRPWETA
ncbi:chaperonin 10-like protein [Suillus clintonianus]|uniref:chaperonin 10-like protein n=1 Tax=Suillus clintonianus TaxID=1904413 RepID=UPI001B8809F3|nr:chaperonin 10-like protein [Suillus clintonianus]KAG2126311.1 chaperonin 10-like protein [Suillus clintonianus]